MVGPSVVLDGWMGVVVVEQKQREEHIDIIFSHSLSLTHPGRKKEGDFCFISLFFLLLKFVHICFLASNSCTGGKISRNLRENILTHTTPTTIIPTFTKPNQTTITATKITTNTRGHLV